MLLLSMQETASRRICDLAQVHGLSVDTSTLTGESVPTAPQPGEIIFAGTFAVEGEAIGIVTATGGSTRLAQIARLTAEGQRPPSPLALELDRLVRVIALVAVAVGSVFLSHRPARGNPTF